MRVGPRLLLFGALLPSVGIVGAVLIAGQLFERSLLGTVDEALRNQATVESVSLFDGPSGAPHLHLLESPRGEDQLLGNVSVAVYGQEGVPILRFPIGADVPAQLRHDDAHAITGPRTTRTPSGLRRELVRNLVSKDNRHFALWLGVPLDGVDATTATFYRVTLSVSGAFAVLLFGVQSWQGRRLSRRIGDVNQQLPRLRRGDFAPRPEPALPARDRDEVDELGATLAEVARELAAARERQERLIANAAHELRTPLGLMRTEIDLALRKERDADELRRALAEARTEVDRLSALAQRLLDLAALRSVSLARQVEDLVPIVRDAVQAIAHEAEARRIAVELDVPSRAEARIAATRIRQALDNLLANALRFAPDGSRIEVGLRAGARGWELSVADHGEGVPLADRARIFEPFFRAHGDGKGSGLGLAIVREIAHEHGGEISLAERDDATEFLLSIEREV